MILNCRFILKFLVVLVIFSSKDVIAHTNDLSVKLEESNAVNKIEPSNSTLRESITPQPNILVEEFSEAGKIILMSMIASVCYGIIHDAITINICFDYFRSDMTHHGPQTKRYFPFVYNSNSKILYSLLWGTIATGG